MKTTESPNDEAEENNKEDGGKNMFSAIWRDIREKARTAKFWLEVLAVFGGLFYAGITYRMWVDTHQNFVIEQQAWVVGILNFPNQVSLGTPMKVTIPITNTGKTAARKVIVECVMSRQKNTDPVPLDYNKIHAVADIGLLTPNQGSPIECYGTVNADQVAETINQTQLEDLTSGRTYLSVYGQGTYVDIFGNVHWVRFCAWKYYYSGVGNSSFNARSCTDYNDTGEGIPPTK